MDIVEEVKTQEAEVVLEALTIWEWAEAEDTLETIMKLKDHQEVDLASEEGGMILINKEVEEEVSSEDNQEMILMFSEEVVEEEASTSSMTNAQDTTEMMTETKRIFLPEEDLSVLEVVLNPAEEEEEGTMLTERNSQLVPPEAVEISEKDVITMTDRTITRDLVIKNVLHSKKERTSEKLEEAEAEEKNSEAEVE